MKSGAPVSAAILSTLSILLLGAAAAPPDSFRFVVIGDRTGEAQPGVYERVWKAAGAEHPAFAVGVGDTIEGLHDDQAEAEWTGARLACGQRRSTLYLAPGQS